MVNLCHLVLKSFVHAVSALRLRVQYFYMTFVFWVESLTVAVQLFLEAKTPAEDEVLPEDFSGFIVLDSGDDSDHEEEDSSKKV